MCNSHDIESALCASVDEWINITVVLVQDSESFSPKEERTHIVVKLDVNLLEMRVLVLLLLFPGLNKELKRANGPAREQYLRKSDNNPGAPFF